MSMHGNDAHFQGFFHLYENVLKKRAFDQPSDLVDIEIQKVCVEIMSSSINIMHKNETEIVNKFLSEL